MRDEASADELQSALREYEKLLDIRQRLVSNQGNIQQIHANVQAGNTVLIGVLMAVAFIATACCGIVLGLALGLQGQMGAQDRKIERMQDYLNAIYLQAPSLRPKDEEEVSSEP